MSQNVSELLGASMAKVREMVDANTVVGTPISTGDGTTLIPISKGSVGFGGGGGDYGKPAAAISSRRQPPLHSRSAAVRAVA